MPAVFARKEMQTTLDLFELDSIFTIDRNLQDLEVVSSDVNHDSDQDQGDGEVVFKEEVKIKKPSMYQVLLHNDDYTTMEFVILVLKRFFGKSTEEATAIMLKVHHDGVGICAIYTYEVAETKSQKVKAFAKQHGYPLKCSIEKVDDES